VILWNKCGNRVTHVRVTNWNPVMTVRAQLYIGTVEEVTPIDQEDPGVSRFCSKMSKSSYQVRGSSGQTASFCYVWVPLKREVISAIAKHQVRTCLLHLTVSLVKLI